MLFPKALRLEQVAILFCIIVDDSNDDVSFPIENDITFVLVAFKKYPSGELDGDGDRLSFLVSLPGFPSVG